MEDKRTRSQQFFDILVYTWPELITAFVLGVLPRILESGFIGNLKSTSTFAALGICVTIIQFIIKVAEGLSTGVVVLVGNDNGVGNYHGVGRTLKDSFWTSVFIGAFLTSLIYFGSYFIFSLYDLNDKMRYLGVSYLRLRAISVFFTFVYFTFVGFLRGIKNTRTPMIIFAIGALTFILVSYPLIFGKWGMAELGLQGAAIAGVIQFLLMTTLAFAYVLFSPTTRMYKINLLQPIDIKKIRSLLRISMPIMMDKATMAITPIWLGNSFSFLGKVATASFSVIKDMERLVLLPSNALGQVSTLLVSNNANTKHWNVLNSIIKRLVVLWVLMSVAGLAILFICRRPCICFFDQKNVFTDFSVEAFFVLGPLMLMDSLQVLLSGILRGAKRVKVVMYTRLAIVFGLFIPSTYLVRQMEFESVLLKFLTIYVIFYLCTGLMAGVYWYYIKRRLKPGQKENYGTNDA